MRYSNQEQRNVKLATCKWFLQRLATATFLVGSTWRGFFGNIGSSGDQKRYPAAYQALPQIWKVNIWNFKNEEMIVARKFKNNTKQIIFYKYMALLVISTWKWIPFWTNMNKALNVYTDWVCTCCLNLNIQYSWSLVLGPFPQDYYPQRIKPWLILTVRFPHANWPRTISPFANCRKAILGWFSPG